jgi:hypothetical protein
MDSKIGGVLPEPGTPGDLRLGVEIEVSKFLIGLLNPIAGAGVKAGHDLVKAFKAYRSAVKDAQIQDFLKQVARSISRHEELIRKLQVPEPAAVARDPFAVVFLKNLEACYNDDEREKALFYAAFAVGIHERDVALTNPARVILFNALKELRTHDLLVLKAIIDFLSKQNRSSDVTGKQVNDTYANEALEAIKSAGIVGIDPSLIEHSFNSLERSGLIRRHGGQGRASVIGHLDPGEELSAMPIGRQLMEVILPNLNA